MYVLGNDVSDNKHRLSKMWDETSFLFLNFNLEVWEWTSSLISHLIKDAIT